LLLKTLLNVLGLISKTVMGKSHEKAGYHRGNACWQHVSMTMPRSERRWNDV
jgi:hypothetical protein